MSLAGFANVRWGSLVPTHSGREITQSKDDFAIRPCSDGRLSSPLATPQSGSKSEPFGTPKAIYHLQEIPPFYRAFKSARRYLTFTAQITRRYSSYI